MIPGMNDLLRRRLEHNEAVFRAVNDEIEELAHGDKPREFVCECADASCDATITLTRTEYEHVRSQPKHYVVVPGSGDQELQGISGIFHLTIEDDGTHRYVLDYQL